MITRRLEIWALPILVYERTFSSNVRQFPSPPHSHRQPHSASSLPCSPRERIICDRQGQLGLIGLTGNAIDHCVAAALKTCMAAQSHENPNPPSRINRDLTSNLSCFWVGLPPASGCCCCCYCYCYCYCYCHCHCHCHCPPTPPSCVQRHIIVGPCLAFFFSHEKSHGDSSPLIVAF
jgi:hypothetical protein